MSYDPSLISEASNPLSQAKKYIPIGGRCKGLASHESIGKHDENGRITLRNPLNRKKPNRRQRIHAIFQFGTTRDEAGGFPETYGERDRFFFIEARWIMDFVFDWIWSLLCDTGSRIEYSVEHANLTQWGIFAISALGLGVMALRSRMPH